MVIVGIFQRGVRFDQAYGEIDGGECPHRWRLPMQIWRGFCIYQVQKWINIQGMWKYIHTYWIHLCTYTICTYTPCTYTLCTYTICTYTYVFQVPYTQILGVHDFLCWHHPSTIHLFWPANCRPWMMTPRSWWIFSVGLDTFCDSSLWCILFSWRSVCPSPAYHKQAGPYHEDVILSS